MKGSDFLWLAMDAFGGLGLEVVYAFWLEPAVYGVPMEEFTPGQTILHWILTCVTWGIVACVLIRKAKGKYRFPILDKGKEMRIWQWGLCVLFLAIAFWIDYVSWGGFKVYLEFVRLGPLLFVFQYIYYMFETMLFLHRVWAESLRTVVPESNCSLWRNRLRADLGTGSFVYKRSVNRPVWDCYRVCHGKRVSSGEQGF